MPSYIEYIPTPHEDIDAFFDLAPVFSSDVVYDLGSGDGRLLFEALEKGAGKAVGVELDAELVRASNEKAKNMGVQDRVTFVCGDLIDTDLADATLIFCYLFPEASADLKPKFESELKPGTRVIMESFYVHGWQEIATISKGGKSFYLYIMPPDKSAEI